MITVAMIINVEKQNQVNSSSMGQQSFCSATRRSTELSDSRLPLKRQVYKGAPVHTHKHTHTHTHTHTSKRSPTYTQTQAYTHTHTCTNTHGLTHMHMHAHKRMHTHTHRNAQTCMDPHMHTHRHTHLPRSPSRFRDHFDVAWLIREGVKRVWSFALAQKTLHLRKPTEHIVPSHLFRENEYPPPTPTVWSSRPYLIHNAEYCLNIRKVNLHDTRCWQKFQTVIQML